MSGFRPWWFGLLVMSTVECQHDAVETKELTECSVMLLESVDKAKLVSKVERPNEVGLDMAMWVEEMLEVLVESVDGAGYPMEDGSSDSWLDSENRLPSVASSTEVETEVVTEVLTSVENATQLLAWVHTIEERKVVLVVQGDPELEVQRDCGHEQESANGQSPP